MREYIGKLYVRTGVDDFGIVGIILKIYLEPGVLYAKIYDFECEKVIRYSIIPNWNSFLSDGGQIERIKV